MKRFFSRAFLSLAIAAALANTAQAEGWYVGGSFNPVLSTVSISGAALAGFNTQVGYQSKEGFGTRLNIGIIATSLDVYQQSNPVVDESGFYLGAGITYSPFLAFGGSSDGNVFRAFGVKGIISYEFKHSTSPVGVFLEYSPIFNFGYFLSPPQFEDWGGIIAIITGITNFQIGLNYRF
jgi:hypothetical protein